MIPRSDGSAQITKVTESTKTTPQHCAGAVPILHAHFSVSSERQPSDMYGALGAVVLGCSVGQLRSATEVNRPMPDP